MAINTKRVHKGKKVGPTKTVVKQGNKDCVSLNARKIHVRNQILYWAFTTLLTVGSGYFFYNRGLSKRDIQPIQAGVERIENRVSELRQDILGNNDYKKYLEMYQVLYKGILEKTFPGGYVTLGIRDNAIFNPGNFYSKYIQLDIGDGTITFNGNDCVADIPLNKIYFVETQNSITDITIRASIENYEIGLKYQSNWSIGEWNNYITILSDDPSNPVIVFGFSKE